MNIYLLIYSDLADPHMKAIPEGVFTSKDKAKFSAKHSDRITESPLWQDLSNDGAFWSASDRNYVIKRFYLNEEISK